MKLKRSQISHRNVLNWALASALTAAVGASGACVNAPTQVFIPVQKTASEQYAYAAYYRNKHEFALRNIDEKERLLTAREAVRQAFMKVVEEFPEDREVTPLAKLELVEMAASLDDQRLKIGKGQVRRAIDHLQALREEYSEIEFIQAKTVYDEALCNKNLERYDRAQELFRRVADEYASHENKQIRTLAERSTYFYQQAYVKGGA